MLRGIGALFRKLGRAELFLLVLAAIDVALRFLAPGSGFTLLINIALYITAIVVAVRLARRFIGRAIWRLRNRLIVAYLFIAVVPIILILALAAIAIYMVTGQVAVYLASSELNRRITALNGAAEALAHTAQENQPEMIRRIAGFIGNRLPNVEVFVRDQAGYRLPPGSALSHPPKGWKDASGVMLRDGRLYAWAHAAAEGTEVTMAAPVPNEFLSALVPGLGDVFFLDLSDSPDNGRGREPKPFENGSPPRRERLPPKYFAPDIQVTGVYPMPVSRWEAPQASENVLLVVHTRTSAVLRVVFGQKLEWGQLILGLFVGVAILFLIVEIISLIIGISITRTITQAVHELYEGTLRIREGDFSHRIAVRGGDQLAELGVSFNNMTENLARLIVVAKEKERLESELQIAREVQKQLFPKDIPILKTLRVTGICNPARTVSGDYYDFIRLAESNLAFAIGDVAGKGISAALLMAAIQSTMRTQLTTEVAVAAGVGNGYSQPQFSTAYLVSQLNRQLYANTAPEKFATFYFGLYDDENQVLTYTNAGHVPPILLRKGEPELLDVTGTVVGAFPFARYEERQIPLESGDLLVGYTDGIIEPENEYGEAFGDDRLKDVLIKHSDRDGGEIIARVMEAVQQWTGAGELQDDMTMVVARRL